MSFATRFTRLFAWSTPVRRDVDSGRIPIAEPVTDERDVPSVADLPVQLDIIAGTGTDEALEGEFERRREPGFADLEAAVELVRTGLATRVILSGFPSWPGLLWQTYELSASAGVSIVTRAAGPDGRVELEVTGDVAEGD